MKEHLKMYFRVFSHPVATFSDIKELKFYSLKYSSLLFLLLLLSQVLNRQFIGFTFNNSNTSKFNIIALFLELLGIVLLWTVSNWAVCTLCYGEGKLKEVYVISLVATIPYSFSMIFYTILSNVLTPDESIFLTTIMTVGILWTAILIFVGLMILHDFSLFRVIWTSILTIALMAVVLFLVVLCYSLFKQITGFGTDIVSEITNRL